MTREEIVAELEKLDSDFALMIRDRATGSEQLATSLNRSGMPEHPAFAAEILLRGVQICLHLCERMSGAITQQTH